MSIDLTKIKMFIMDVDGTLTDGKIYIGHHVRHYYGTHF